MGLLSLGQSVGVVSILMFVSSVRSYNVSFVQREVNGQCSQAVHHSNGRVISHLGTGQYSDGLDCQVTVSVPQGRRIFLRFDRFDVTDSVNCFQDEVLVYDGSTISSPMLTGRLYGLCGSLPRQYQTMHSTGNEVTVRFITDDVTTENKGFAISYVSYIPGGDASGPNECFQCRESLMCIDRHLMCDNLWHCPDGSDESFRMCYDSVETEDESSAGNGWLSWTGTHLAMAFAVAAGLFIIVSVAVCCCCHRASSENENSTSTPRVVTDANMYYIQQAQPEAFPAVRAKGASHKGASHRSSVCETRDNVFNAEASDAVLNGFPSVSAPSAPSAPSTNSDWWNARRSCGDGCQEEMPSYDVYEHHHHHHLQYPEVVDYDSEATSRSRQEHYVTNMSFIEQQEMRWQFLTGQHHTRVDLPPEPMQ